MKIPCNCDILGTCVVSNEMVENILKQEILEIHLRY